MNQSKVDYRYFHGDYENDQSKDRTEDGETAKFRG